MIYAVIAFLMGDMQYIPEVLIKTGVCLVIHTILLLGVTALEHIENRNWRIKNSLVEPIDNAQRNIYDIYMDLLKNSGHEFDHPEIMIYMIIEMVAGSCYNVILTGEPTSIDELKPYLYQSIRLIIQNHIVS